MRVWVDAYEHYAKSGYPEHAAGVIAREIVAAHAAGVAQERAAVVAWFHNSAESSRAHKAVRVAAQQLADAIADGQHRKGDEG